MRKIDCTFTLWKVSLRALRKRGEEGGGVDNPDQVDGTACLFIPIQNFVSALAFLIDIE